MEKQNFPHVTILILNWNGLRFLKENLPSVFEQDYPNFDILVVDNGSTDESVYYLKRLQKKQNHLQLLELGDNLLFVRGNNKGIEHILKQGKSKYIAFLNNDAKVTSAWLSTLVKGFASDEIGLCASHIMLYFPYLKISIKPKEETILRKISISGLVYYPLMFDNGFEEKGAFLDMPKKLEAGKMYNFAIPYGEKGEGSLVIDYKGEIGKLIVEGKKLSIKSKDEAIVDLSGKHIIQNAGTDFNQSRMVFEDRHIFEFSRRLTDEYVDAGCAAAMLVRTDLLKKYGGFWDKYVMYWEDSELSYRIGRAGYKVKFVNNAVVYHQYWGSSGNKITALQTFYGTRNRLWFIRRYFGMKKFGHFYLRTLIRTIVWGLDIIKGMPEASMFFKCYLKVLLSSIQKDN